MSRDRSALLAALENEHSLLRLELELLTGQAADARKIVQLQRDNAKLRSRIDQERRALVARHLASLTSDLADPVVTAGREPSGAK
jgi:hypothetical protein